jgi:hypothetical protein
MIRNEYIKELGVDPTTRTVPWPYALAVLALLAAGVIWFAVSETHSNRSVPRADHASLTAQRPGTPPDPSAIPAPARGGRLTRGVA